MPSLPPAIELASTGRGKGPLVVGLHDLGKTGVSMQMELSGLGKRFRVVAPDLRGHGSSPIPKAPWSVDDFSSDVSRVVKNEGGNAVVAGRGLGAAAAVAMALGHPDTVRGLVLTGLGAKPEDETRSDQWTHLAQSIRDELGAEGLALATEAFGRRPDWRKALSQVTVPVLVLAGAKDRVVPPAAQRELAMWFPNGSFLSVPDTDHLVPGKYLVDAVRSLSGSPAVATRAA